MIYDNEQVRRKDRLLDEPQAIELLRTSEYGVLSMADDGQPYAIPLNYVWDGASSLYAHCAPEGRKLRVLEQNGKVSFCIVGGVHLLPSQFTTEYESLVLEGRASVVSDEEEKRRALRLLIEKLAPSELAVGDKYIEKSFHRTAVLRIDIRTWSGKRKKVHRTKE